MTELGPVSWPPDPIRIERLVLREPEARDRAAITELFAAPEVCTCISGPRQRDEVECGVPEAPERRPGLLMVDLDGAMTGIVTLGRRDPEHPVHVHSDASSAEFGSMRCPASRWCSPPRPPTSARGLRRRAVVRHVGAGRLSETP